MGLFSKIKHSEAFGFSGMWKFVPTRKNEVLTDEQKRNRFGQNIRGETVSDMEDNEQSNSDYMNMLKRNGLDPRYARVCGL